LIRDLTLEVDSDRKSNLSQHNYQIIYQPQRVQITGAIREGSMRRRQALIIELQERVRRIQTEIEREQEKIEGIEYNIQRKREDLEFHLTLLHELEVQETTIETEREEITEAKVETRLADSERSPAKLTREQYLEQKERARVWNLNREREAQAKSRRR
jgi:hypothetical protein